MPEKTLLHQAVLRGDAATAQSLTAQSLADGTTPLDLVNHSLIPAMDEVGKKFESNEYFVPELLLSARAMKAAMAQIRPLLIASGENSAGRIVIGTVRGDLHDIGKNLVAAMLEGGGFEVFDLGVNVTPEQFVEAATQHQATLVGLSALLTTTMGSMQKTIEAFEKAGIRDQVKVMIGGAPVSSQFALTIGADGYGENAPDAVAIARKLVALPTHHSQNESTHRTTSGKWPHHH